jgi:hypothetical protein
VVEILAVNIGRQHSRGHPQSANRTLKLRHGEPDVLKGKQE